MRRFNRELLIVFFLLVVVACVYWPTLQSGFVPWDDDTEIYQNPHLRGIDAASLQWMFTDVAYVWRYQPLTWLTWFSIYSLQGLAPFGYHLANFLFHALNTVLVFFLIRQLLLVRNLAERGSRPSDHLLLCAAGGALLWGIHPLRVEPVAWVSGFLHCQSLTFLLLSALGYLLSFKVESSQWRFRLYWMSVACFAASLLSYPIGIGFVVVIAALDFYPLNRFSEGPGRWWNAQARKVWLSKAPFVLVAFGVTALGLLARFNPASSWPHPISLQSFSLASRAMQAFYLWAYYFWKPFFPVHLAPFYTQLYQFQPTEPRFLASVALVAIVTGLALWQHNRWRLFFVAWICHLAVLVPVLGLTEHPHFPSDRYSLLSAIIWAAVASAVFFKYATLSVQRIGLLVGGAALAVLGFLAHQQTFVWHDGAALFTHTLKTLHSEPYITTFQVRRAAALEAQMDYEQALAQDEILLAKYPDADSLKNKISTLLLRLGRKTEARERYLKALEQHPENAELRNGLGVLLAMDGDFTGATNQFWEALRRNPQLAISYHNLGLVALKRGQTNEAEQFFARERELSQPAPKTP